MALLNRKTIIAVAAESNEGQAASTGATHADFNIFETSLSVDVDQYERNPFRTSVGRRTSIAGTRTGTIDFMTELVGSGSKTTPPPFGKLLLPCGFTEHAVDKYTGTLANGTFGVGDAVSGATSGTGTVVAVDGSSLYIEASAALVGTISQDGVSGGVTLSATTRDADEGYVYKSATAPSAYSQSNVPTATITMDIDGVRHKLIGARGSVSLRSEVGQPVMMNFSFTGSKQATANTPSAITGISYPTANPPTLLNANFSTQGFSGVINSFEVNSNNDLQVRRDANSTSGLLSTKIVSRGFTGQVDPELTKVSGTGSHDWFGIMEGNTTGEFSVGCGSSDGNTFLLKAPTCQYTGITPGDRNGIATNSVDLAFNESTQGDDDFQIVCL